jgi:hypothetical protein
MIIGFGIGVGVTALAPSITQQGDKAGQELISFLENQSNQDLELVKTEERSGMYEVQISNEDNQLTTYYVTRDGKLYTSSMRNITNVRENLNQIRNFQSCLEDSGVVMYGNASQRTTQAQIRQLGGIQVVQPIYKDVSNNQTLAEAVQLGIQQVPAFHDGSSSIEGLQTLGDVSNFTGCDQLIN